MQKLREEFDAAVSLPDYKKTHQIDNMINFVAYMRVSRKQHDIRYYKRLQFFWTKFQHLIKNSSRHWERYVFSSIEQGNVFIVFHCPEHECFKCVKPRKYLQGAYLHEIYSYYKL